MDQDLAERDPDRDARRHADQPEERALDGEHRDDLAPAHPDMAHHAEFLDACDRLRREGGGDPGQADQDRDRLERIGDREAPVEQPQRAFAQRGGFGEIHAPGNIGRQSREDRRAHGRNRGARHELDRGLAAHGIAGDRRIVARVDHDGALLPGIVTPDPRDIAHHLGAARADRQRESVTGLRVVKPRCGLGQPERDAAPRPWRPLDHRQRIAGPRHRAHDQRRWGKLRIERDGQALAEGDSRNPRRCGEAALRFGVEQGLVRCRGDVEIGAEEAFQPVVHRAAKAGDHHRHRDHQPGARDDAAERDRGLAGRAEQAAERHLECGDAQLRAAQRPQQQARQPGHRRDPAGQHKPDREIAEERQPVHRREKGAHGPGTDQGHGREDAGRLAWVDLIARILERQRGRDPCGAPGGHVASGKRGRDAKAEEEHRRFGRERERRCRAAEIARAEIAADQAQRDTRDRIASRQANQRAHNAQGRALAQQLAGERPFLQAERAEQRELAQPPRHRERLRRIDEETAGQQRDQREHVEVDAIGARKRVAAPALGLGIAELRVGGQDRR